MGKVKYVLLLLLGFCFIAKAQENEYAPKISFKDIVESQVGVVKKVVDLNEEVKQLKQAMANLEHQQEKTYEKLAQIENQLKAENQKPSKTQNTSVSMPPSYQNLINQAKTWAK